MKEVAMKSDEKKNKKEKATRTPKRGYITAEELVGKCEKQYNERLIEMEVLARFFSVGGP